MLCDDFDIFFFKLGDILKHFRLLNRLFLTLSSSVVDKSELCTALIDFDLASDKLSEMFEELKEKMNYKNQYKLKH